MKVPCLGDQIEMRRYKQNDSLTEVGPSLERKKAIYARLDNDVGHTRRTKEEDKFSERATKLKEQVILSNPISVSFKRNPYSD